MAEGKVTDPSFLCNLVCTNRITLSTAKTKLHSLKKSTKIYNHPHRAKKNPILKKPDTHHQSDMHNKDTQKPFLPQHH
jgi:hypothetical protein